MTNTVTINTSSYGAEVREMVDGTIKYGGRSIALVDKVKCHKDAVKRLGETTATVLGHIMYFMGKDGYFNASYGITAVKLRLSRSTVRNAFKRLIDERYIEVFETRYGAGVYRCVSDNDIAASIFNDYHFNTGNKFYFVNLALLPKIINGKDCIALRGAIHTCAVITNELVKEHNNGNKDLKYSPQSFANVARFSNVSQPTAKVRIGIIEKLGLYASRFVTNTKILILDVVSKPLIKTILKRVEQAMRVKAKAKEERLRQLELNRLNGSILT